MITIPLTGLPNSIRLGQDFTKVFCPNAENYFKGAITLPLHQSLTAEQQQEVIAALASSINEVTEQNVSTSKM